MIETIKTMLKQKSYDLKEEIHSKMVKVDGEYRNVPEMLVGERAGIECALLIIEKVEKEYGSKNIQPSS